MHSFELEVKPFWFLKKRISYLGYKYFMITYPWLSNNNAPYLKFYHYNNSRKNTSAIYAPALDRFILVDNCDFWATLETAKIMSAKIATQVCLLDENIIEFDNTNCFEFTIANKAKYVINGSNIVSARQTPILHPIHGTDAIINVGLPPEFQLTDNKDKIIQLHEYTRFVLRCVHAINFTDALVHIPSVEEMVDDYCPELLPINMTSSLNYTSAPGGMKKYIKRILYNSDTVSEAISKIDSAWSEYSVYNDPIFKNIFDYFLGTAQSINLGNNS